MANEIKYSSFEEGLWTENKMLREELVRFKTYDKVTGLYRRDVFKEIIEDLDKEGHYPLAIVLADINGFKLINDAFGFDTGDQLLRDIGKRMNDSINDKETLFRWGEDEFMLILPNCDEKRAGLFCMEMKEKLSKLDLLLNTESLSFGYAIRYDETLAISSHIQAAEDYMRKSKLLAIKSSRSSIIQSMLLMLSEKSAETEAHAKRLCDLSKKTAYRLGIRDGQIYDLELLCKLHDIGKVTVGKNILHKPGKLTAEEWSVMRGHSEAGSRILGSIPELTEIADLVHHHHERWDGKGYPKGIKGEEIPLLCRILSVVDTFDAMTNDRVYRKALPIGEAIVEIKKNAGFQFDMAVVKAFLDVLKVELAGRGIAAS